MSDKEILHRTLRFLLPYKKQMIILFMVILVSSGIQLAIPLISQRIMDEGILKQDIHRVVVYAWYTILLLIADQGIGLIETKNISYVNSLFHYSLQKLAFKHSLKLGMDYYNNKNINEIISTLTADAGNIVRICDRGIFSLLSQFIRIIGGGIGLFIIEWRLALVVVLFTPLRFIASLYLSRKRKKIFEQFLECNRLYSSWYGETLGGIKEIKLWGLYYDKTHQFIRMQRQIIRMNIKMALIDKVNGYTEGLLFQIISNIIYTIGAYLVFRSDLTLGGLFAFLTYSTYVVAPLSSLMNIKYLFASITPSARRFFEFLDRKTEEDRPLAAIRAGGGKPTGGGLSFHGVSFAYPDGREVLHEVSLQLHPGEIVVLTGENGSGKSTLLNLLLRFSTPQKGEIRLDGVNIEQIRLKTYRQLVAAVSQDSYLFNASIEENIQSGLKLNKERLTQALEDSNAAPFIRELPLSLASPVGRNGASLSGGQRQKVVVARALAKDAPILILDEATSNYDQESEVILNERLLAYRQQNKTVIIVSHKPHTVKHADRFLRVEGGKVTEYRLHAAAAGV